VPDLPIGYIGLSLGPQDPRGPPTNCGIESLAGIWSLRSNFIKNVCLNYYSRNLVLLNFRGDNASLSTSFHESQYDGWSSRMPTIASIYSKHAGCVLRLLNRTDCCVRLHQKNLWLFMFEMHLISGITDGWQRCESPPPPCQAKCKNRALTYLVFWYLLFFWFQ